ncbi:MAG: hypothetical protein R3264_21215 [Anaerolineae bacterium]|nr:hypothetical protein [Anaerolineae bacterium]
MMRLQYFLERVELAEQVGLDVIGLGEHHRIGTADNVIEKILLQHEIFGHQRFLLMMGMGTMPHKQVMHGIELFGTKVAPVVRAEIARRKA